MRRTTAVIVAVLGVVFAGLVVAGILLVGEGSFQSRPASAVSRVRWVTTTVASTWNGLKRYYLVTRPASKAGPLPVLVVLHGHSVTPASEERRTAFTSVTGPAILVYPAGWHRSWNAGYCCRPARTAHVDDLGFLEHGVDQVLRDQPQANPKQVYLVGYSNGGKMALSLSCAEPDDFRAVAVYGAVLVRRCVGPPPTSLLQVDSTRDPKVTIGPAGTPKRIGSFVESTVAGEVARYRAADGCGPASRTTTSGRVTVTLWMSCADRRLVGEALYAGGSHAWPSGEGPTPSAASVMWTFFREVGAPSLP